MGKDRSYSWETRTVDREQQHTALIYAKNGDIRRIIE